MTSAQFRPRGEHVANRLTARSESVTTRARGNADRVGSLVASQVEGGSKPLFWVSGGPSEVANTSFLVRTLAADKWLSALRWDAVRLSRRSRSIAAIAERCLPEIRRVQATGSYILLGEGSGGLIAQEICRMLIRDGNAVDLLVMYDAPHMASGHYVRPSLLERVVTAVRTPGAKARARREVEMWRCDLQSRVGREVSASNRQKYAQWVVNRAVQRHVPNPPDVHTLLFTTGETNARLLGLRGRWTDDAMGWSSYASDRFEIHPISSGPPYDPSDSQAGEILNDALATVEGRRWPD